ncbi:MAG: hypothetical protein NTY38_07000 [Acidobacteria bacterium]|nr:hypothetical protein [Acidobacteriota bacterium]
MRQTLHIFRKDVRRLRYEIGVLLLLNAVFAWAAGHETGSRFAAPWPGVQVVQILWILLPLGWSYVAALLMYGESLTGDRQFWLTRPYRRSSLFAAKLLFVASFVFVPAVLQDALILSWQGFSPWANLGGVLIHSLELAAIWTLPALALASVTTGLPQLLLAVALIFGGLASAAALGIPPELSWTPRMIPRMDAALAGSLCVLGIQYRWRRTTAARVVVGLAVVVTFVAWLPLPVAWTLRIQQLATPRVRDISSYQISLRSGFGEIVRGRRSERALILSTEEKPPQGMGAIVDLAEASISMEDGRRFELSAIGGPDPSFPLLDPSMDLRGRARVHLRIFATLFAYDTAGAARATRTGGQYLASDFRCREDAFRLDSGEVICRAPFRQPAFYLEWSARPRHEPYIGARNTVSYAPFPATIDPLPIKFARELPPQGAYYGESGAIVRLHPAAVIPVRIVGQVVREIDAAPVILRDFPSRNPVWLKK